jgi:hypothetical protein
MRPLRKCGLLVAVLVLVAPACGSSPPQRTVKTAAATGPPSLGRWWHFSPTTTTAPAPPAPVVPSTVPSPRRRAVSPARPATGGGTGWEALRQCENGGSYAGSSNGYYGAYQFDRGTWGAQQKKHPEIGSWGSASPDQQDAAARYLYSERGTAPWPVCGRHLHG